MTPIPAFEMGVWNAWILMLPVMLTIPFYLLIGKRRGPSPPRELNASKIEKTITFSLTSLDFLAMIYSVFLPLKLWTPWFYVGFPVALLGIIGIIMGSVNWATTPPDAPVAGGLYHYTRHPFYIAYVLILLGVGIATASWLFLLYCVVYVVGISSYVHTEEEGCLEKYGNTYREYMNRTPRWIGIPRRREWRKGEVDVGEQEQAGPGRITASRVVHWVLLLAALSVTVGLLVIWVLPQWQESEEEPVVSQPSAQVVPTTMWINLYSPASLLDGNPLPVGAVITAYDPGGILCGEFTVVRPGQYGLMPVYADDATTTWDEGAVPGENISLRINGFPARTIPAEIRWTSLGDLLRVDLVATTPPSHPQG